MNALKYVVAVLFAVAGAAVYAADAGPNPLVLAAREGVVGERAPTMKLTTIDGDTIDLAQLLLEGKKAVYLKFWATWCIPCREQMPHFENVYQHAGDDLAVIALNAGFNDNLDDILDYRAALGIHMPIVVDDGTLAAAFNFRITPQHVVIGKDGIVKYIGNMADAELDAVIERERKAPLTPPAVVRLQRTQPVPHLDVGAALPITTLKIGDQAVQLGTKTEQGTVLVFMIPWCESYLVTTRPQQAAACREVREQVEALRTQQPALRWLGVSSGLWTVAADLKDYAQQNAVTLPLGLDVDGRMFHAFGVQSVPTIIVADADGRIVKRIEGYDAALGNVLTGLQRQ